VIFLHHVSDIFLLLGIIILIDFRKMRSTPLAEKRKCDALTALFNVSSSKSIFDTSATSGAYCEPHSDGLCWSPAPAGTVSYIECPFNLCPSCNISWEGKIYILIWLYGLNQTGLSISSLRIYYFMFIIVKYLWIPTEYLLFSIFKAKSQLDNAFRMALGALLIMATVEIFGRIFSIASIDLAMWGFNVSFVIIIYDNWFILRDQIVQIRFDV